MNAPATRIAVAALIALAVLGASGCRATPSPQDGGQASTAAETVASSTAAALATSAVATEPAAVTTAPVPPIAEPVPTPEPAPSDTADTSDVKLGPKDAAVSWAYLKEMYKKNGHWYVVVDYVQVVGPEETIHFVNQNPKLRTFPLSKGADLLLLKRLGEPKYKSVSAAEFNVWEGKSGKQVVEVTPKGGYATKLKQWWSP